MPIDPPRREKRRAERVLLRVPIQVHGVGLDAAAVSCEAEDLVVSRFGALLRIPAKLKKESQVSVIHCFSAEKEDFRVVWVAEMASEGRYDTGVEAKNPREGFWGLSFPPAAPAH